MNDARVLLPEHRSVVTAEQYLIARTRNEWRRAERAAVPLHGRIHTAAVASIAGLVAVLLAVHALPGVTTIVTGLGSLT